MARTLVLLRHGQSEWNLLNLFTGWKDPGLSDLVRAGETLTTTQAVLGQDLKPIVTKALRERDYGDLSGLNKDEARDKWGAEQVRIWRRSYDTPPPGGDSLRDTVARALPYYCQAILPCVLRGENVLVVAHGNSLRALVMVLDGLNPTTIPTVEIQTGVPLVYQIGPDAVVQTKKIIEPDIEPRLPDDMLPRG